MWDQELPVELRRRVDEWVDATILPFGDEWEVEGCVPRRLFADFAEAGFLAYCYPESLGGSGGPFEHQVVIAQALYSSGFGGVALSLLGHSGIALHPLASIGSEAQREEWLIPALRGERIAGLAVSEPDAGSDVSGLQTAAVRDGDEWVLNGRKVFVTLGTSADFLIVAARSLPHPGAKGLSLFLVPTDSPGLRIERRMGKLGMRSSDTAVIAFTDCRVPSEALIGSEGEGFKPVMRQFDAERIILSAGALAIGRRALELALTRIKGRVQFGRPLSTNQGLQHAAVESLAALAAADALLEKCTLEYSGGDYEPSSVAMLKLVAARTGFEAADLALQFFGGWGYVDDHPIERMWRDVRLMRIGGGTDEIMMNIASKRFV
jgi:acyl-CoA dehydrogenase